jgi:hypothetical protein
MRCDTMVHINENHVISAKDIKVTEQIPYGYCHCGCGQKTEMARQTHRKKGWIKGEPYRFVPRHHLRVIGRERIGQPRSEETRQKISETHKAKGTRPSAEGIAKSNANRPTGENSPSWKGGYSFVNGYRCVRNQEHPRAHPNGYVYEHIIVAETKLGRPLAKGEVVHHIDMDKANNHPDNLQVFASQSEHARHHRAIDHLD